MSDKFLGQIMMAGFGFAPRGFAVCSGQILSIAQNTALFSLLGTTYGGNGQTTFALPDLRGRTPLSGMGSTDGSWQPPVTLGQLGGVENVTLNATQVPQHTHVVAATNAAGNSRLPSARVHAQSINSGGAPVNLYAPAGGSVVPLNGVAPSVGSQPHPNLQPYTSINFCIALAGIFPSRN